MTNYTITKFSKKCQKGINQECKCVCIISYACFCDQLIITIVGMYIYIYINPRQGSQLNTRLIATPDLRIPWLSGQLATCLTQKRMYTGWIQQQILISAMYQNATIHH